MSEANKSEIVISTFFDSNNRINIEYTKKTSSNNNNKIKEYKDFFKQLSTKESNNNSVEFFTTESEQSILKKSLFVTDIKINGKYYPMCLTKKKTNGPNKGPNRIMKKSINNCETTERSIKNFEFTRKPITLLSQKLKLDNNPLNTFLLFKNIQKVVKYSPGRIQAGGKLLQYLWNCFLKMRACSNIFISLGCTLIYILLFFPRKNEEHQSLKDTLLSFNNFKFFEIGNIVPNEDTNNYRNVMKGINENNTINKPNIISSKIVQMLKNLNGKKIKPEPYKIEPIDDNYRYFMGVNFKPKNSNKPGLVSIPLIIKIDKNGYERIIGYNKDFAKSIYQVTGYVFLGKHELLEYAENFTKKFEKIEPGNPNDVNNLLKQIEKNYVLYYSRTNNF